MTEQRDRAGVLVPPPLITLAAVLLGWFVGRIAPLQVLPDDLRGVGRYAGWAIVVIAIALGASAVGLFARAGTTPNPMRPTTALVVRGPYRFTRNPMYLGFAILMAGIALIANNAWIAIMIVPDVIATRLLVIGKEERYLSAKFGAEYDAYRSRVRRWF